MRKNANTQIIYLITITGQCALVTTPDATLPINNLLILELPLVPMIIRLNQEMHIINI